MNAFRRVILAMRGYAPGEQPSRGGYVKLNTNENPYPPSPRVLEAVRRAAHADVRLYPDPLASSLRHAAARLYGIAPEQVLVGNGSDDLLTILMRACIGAGDRAAYAVPTYSLYDTLVEIQEGTAVRVPYPDDFSLPAGLGHADARLTVVCNPNSPSGTATPLDVLEQLAGGVAGLLVVDEAYADFGDTTALPLLVRHDNVLILRTLSKSYSLAGIRIGLALASTGVIAELTKVKDSYNVNRLSTAAGVAALEDQEWMRRNVDRIRTTRSRLSEELCNLGYTVPQSQANFVLARRRGVDQEPTYRRLKENGILVRHFRTDGLHDALRITVGTDEEVDRLLEELRARG